MIERMKKVSLIVHHDARVETVNGLQRIGVLHIEQKTPVSGERITWLNDHIAFLTKYLNLLTKYQTDFKVNLPQDDWTDAVAELAGEIDALKNGMDDLTTRIEHLRKEEAILAHFGDFDPVMLEGLERNQVRVAFCSCAKSKFDKLDTSTLALQVLSESRGGISYVVFVRKDARLSEKEQEVLANQHEIPKRSLNALRAEIAKCRKEFDAKQKTIIDRTKYINCIKNHLLRDQDLLAHEIALTGMSAEAEGAVYVLTGFAPVDKVPAVEEFLKTEDVVYLLEEPTHHDNVPVKLKQNPFARLFQPILRLLSIPNYWEVDVTPYFAPFYFLFFGLCIGDAGYGFLLLAVLGIAYLVIKKVETRRFLMLGIMLSISCVIGGVLLDDYFGVRPVVEYEHEMKEYQAALAAGEPVGEEPHSPGILMQLAFLRNQEDAMLFPLMLGVIQVIFGWMLRIRNQVRHHGWQGFGVPTGNILVMLGVMLWVLPMMMQPLFKADPTTFHIGPLQINLLFSALPAWAGVAMLASGLTLILLFNSLDGGSVFLRPLKGLWTVYELAQHLVGDTLSYIRLFALGLAGGLLAEAFNGIGATIVGGGQSPVLYIFAALVILLGHSINMGIGLISAFVHSLRLQFVEFYNAVEFKGGGVEYAPLQTSQPVASTQGLKKQ